MEKMARTQNEILNTIFDESTTTVRSFGIEEVHDFCIFRSGLGVVACIVPLLKHCHYLNIDMIITGALPRRGAATGMSGGHYFA